LTRGHVLHEPRQQPVGVRFSSLSTARKALQPLSKQQQQIPYEQL
jgi:hypothetical protein